MRNVFVLIVVLLLSGCVTTPQPVTVTGPESDYQNAADFVKEKKYSKAIAAYHKIAASSPQSPLAADSLFEVAYLQAFYDNPQKDYAQALEGFDEFLKRFPNHVKAGEAKNWQLILKTIVDTKKENERLRESIEELNKLDIRHEEKRREK
ncbi:MAG TPA: outer membrane protein assembly factor BamD [Nitrospirota bacterium]|nr:outer membrane protein assembly factor BamD [Nitrospirota bacterium]